MACFMASEPAGESKPPAQGMPGAPAEIVAVPALICPSCGARYNPDTGQWSVPGPKAPEAAPVGKARKRSVFDILGVVNPLGD